MIDLIKAMEALDRPARRDCIVNQLQRHSMQFRLHPYSTGTNIIAGCSTAPRIVVSAHYDAAADLTGANDNLSGCAVILELLRFLDPEALMRRDIGLIFFDEEERDLRGSAAYCDAFRPSAEMRVINLEMVGRGEEIAAWGMTNESSPLVQGLAEAANGIGVNYNVLGGDLPLHADHRSFVRHGVLDALSLTMVDPQDVKIYRAWVEDKGPPIARWRRLMTAPLFTTYHRPSDLAQHLRAKSLHQMAALLVRYLSTT